jgi:hypothetical protein
LFGFSVTGVLTLGLIASVIMLIRALPEHIQSPTQLLLSAAALWVTNILDFAVWYWRLDAGGPHGRDQAPGHDEGAFLFPQMTLRDETSGEAQTGGAETQLWSPNFVDYLFLAFNTSTAFSPTDVPVLARWAKGLMMVQSLISLTVLALLAARAVNILKRLSICDPVTGGAVEGANSCKHSGDQPITARACKAKCAHRSIAGPFIYLAAKKGTASMQSHFDGFFAQFEALGGLSGAHTFNLSKHEDRAIGRR